MTNLPTPELQAAVERLVGMARFLRLEATTERKKAARGNKDFWLLRASVHERDAEATDLILAALEERGKALEAYEAAKDRIAADSYDGIDDRSRELLETASQLARFAITALGGTADV